MVRIIVSSERVQILGVAGSCVPGEVAAGAAGTGSCAGSEAFGAPGTSRAGGTSDGGCAASTAELELAPSSGLFAGPGSKASRASESTRAGGAGGCAATAAELEVAISSGLLTLNNNTNLIRCCLAASISQ